MFVSYRMCLVTLTYGVLQGNVVYRTTFICITPTENSPHSIG